MRLEISTGAKWMVVSIVSFSLMHLCVKAIENIPVHQIISFRSLFSLFLCLYTLRVNHIPMLGNNKPLLVLRGIVGALSLFCFFYSIKNLPLATAVTISNLIPLFTLVLAMLFLKEKINHRHWLFFLVSFMGVLLIKGFDYRVNFQDLLIALAAAFFTACAHFLVRKLRDFDDPNVIIAYFPFVTLLFVGPYTAFHWVAPTYTEWGLLVLIGIFTHIGQVYLTRAYAEEEVSGITNIYYIGILLSLFYGYVFFDESYPVLSFIGMIFILVGIGLNIYAKSRKST